MIKSSVWTNPRLKNLVEAFEADDLFMRQLQTPLADKFRANEKRLFATEGASGGNKWPALSPAYARRKAGLRRADSATRRRDKKLGLKRKVTIAGRTLLVLGGALRDSLTQPGSSDYISRIEGRTIVLGTRNPLAHYHYEGRKPLPKRRAIQYTARQREEYLAICVREYRKRIAAAVRSLRAAGSAPAVSR